MRNFQSQKFVTFSKPNTVKSWRLGMLKQYFFSIPITRKLRLNMVHQNTFVTIVYKWKKIRKIKHTL